eukprot:2263652-Prymnesium_polylepis.1
MGGRGGGWERNRASRRAFSRCSDSVSGSTTPWQLSSCSMRVRRSTTSCMSTHAKGRKASACREAFHQSRGATWSMVRYAEPTSGSKCLAVVPSS